MYALPAGCDAAGFPGQAYCIAMHRICSSSTQVWWLQHDHSHTSYDNLHKLAAHSAQDAIRQAQSLPESLSEHNLKQTLPGLLPALVTDRLQPQHCHYLQFAAIQVTSLSEPVPCLLHLHMPLCKLSLWPSCGGGAATAFMLLVMLLARRIVCACISSWQHIYLLADASSSKCT